MHRYGVSKVYSEQCGYALVDVQSAYTTIRTVCRQSHHAMIDLGPKAQRYGFSVLRGVEAIRLTPS